MVIIATRPHLVKLREIVVKMEDERRIVEWTGTLRRLRRRGAPPASRLETVEANVVIE